MTENPYAAPTPVEVEQKSIQVRFAPEDVKKLAAIIADARQFWIGILLCLFCGALGIIVIPPWYTFRLIQCYSLARKYPELLQPSESGSLPSKFQNAKIKLIIGLVGAIFVGVVLFSIVIIDVGSAFR